VIRFVSFATSAISTFADGQAERLLDVDVLAGAAGIDELQRVPVVRRGDDDSIHVLLFEELAKSVWTVAYQTFCRAASR
jgi:hypothetical protein